jgi:hypothetical protein
VIRTLLALALLAPSLAAQTPATGTPASAEPLPPLSLSDAEWLTDRAQLILEHSGEAETPEDVRLARLMIQAVIDYVQLSDQRRSSLADYHFTYLGKTSLETPAQPVDFSFTMESPMRSVQALGLRATRVPVEIEMVALETTAGEPVTLRPALTLDPDVPGRSFLYLLEPTTVTRITVVARTDSDRRPRVLVWLGQAPRPEYLRQALNHLGEARGALEEADADRAAAELDQARRLIARAERSDPL